MIKVIAVGKLKEAYVRQAVSQLFQTISQYQVIELIEVEDEACGEQMSDKQKDKVLVKESERIFKHLAPTDKVIVLAIDGQTMTTQQLNHQVATWINQGRDISWIIGGSLGLATVINRRADLMLSFGPMTFPHQLMRWVLLEQIAMLGRE